MDSPVSTEGIINSYATGMLTSALNHNAATVQFASELVAAGPIKPTKLKQVRRQFDKIHDNYQAESKRISDILTEELKSRGVEL